MSWLSFSSPKMKGFNPFPSLKNSLELMKFFTWLPATVLSLFFLQNSSFDQSFLNSFFGKLNVSWTKADIDFAIQHAEKFEGEEALKHLFRVASSLDL